MKQPPGFRRGSTASTAPNRLAYSPGLDGLRAVACIAVMGYHLGWFHMTGGFLGVTVFFTLSGYLITSLLLSEFRETGKLDLRAFWRRRVYRIVPLFWTVSVTCGLVGLATATTLGSGRSRRCCSRLLS